jgi:hypothetical protein
MDSETFILPLLIEMEKLHMKTTILLCSLFLFVLLSGCSATSAWLVTPEAHAQKQEGCRALKADHERHYSEVRAIVQDVRVRAAMEAEHIALEKFFDACLAKAQ